jgi:hypothetical protein
LESIGSGGEGGDEVEVVLVTEADSQADSSSVVHGEGVVTGSRYRGREDNCGTVRTGVGEREGVISEVQAWLATDVEEKILGVAKSEECEVGIGTHSLGERGSDNGYGRDVKIGVRQRS